MRQTIVEMLTAARKLTSTDERDKLLRYLIEMAVLEAMSSDDRPNGFSLLAAQDPKEGQKSALYERI